MVNAKAARPATRLNEELRAGPLTSKHRAIQLQVLLHESVQSRPCRCLAETPQSLVVATTQLLQRCLLG